MNDKFFDLKKEKQDKMINGAMRDYYSERVTSRIQSEYDIIPLYGDDIRLKKRII